MTHHLQAQHLLLCLTLASGGLHLSSALTSHGGEVSEDLLSPLPAL